MSISSATTFLSVSPFILTNARFFPKKYFASSSRLCSQFSYLGMYIINLTRVCTVFLFRFLPWLHISSLGEGKKREAVGDRDKAKDNQAAVMLMKDSHFKYLLTLTTATFLIRILIACHTYYPCSSIGPFF